jgi:glycosyltransferase involved in cell wall biosynthesis
MVKFYHVSVVICCYNSISRLPQTLKHLSLQEFNIGLIWEIVIVDNNSTDNTGEIATQIWKSLNSQVSLRVVHEDSPGLSNARIKGVFVAEGEIIVFCDDDNWLDPNYLFTAYNIMSTNKSIGVLGGQSRAVSEYEIPTWFYTYYQYFACGVQGLNSGDVTYRKWLWGAGMVLRRQVMIEFYSILKNKLTGRVGLSFSSGEDVEICYWHILAGFKLWYSNDLCLFHFMPQSRLDLDKAQIQFEGQSKSSNVLTDDYNIVCNYLEYKNSPNPYFSILKQILFVNVKKGIQSLRYLLIFKGFLKNTTYDSAVKIGNTYFHK